jgi:hypothetical protein
MESINETNEKKIESLSAENAHLKKSNFETEKKKIEALSAENQ